MKYQGSEESILVNYLESHPLPNQRKQTNLTIEMIQDIISLLPSAPHLTENNFGEIGSDLSTGLPLPVNSLTLVIFPSQY